MIPAYELGTILRNAHSYIENGSFNGWQRRTLFALSRCRTAAMGGHIDQCDHMECGHLHMSYNSCRNRHCPKCLGHKQAKWIAAREADLLPIPYYHVVFTLPSELHQLALHKPRLLYATLFKTAWATIKGFGDNPAFLGAKTGMIAILHTWGQNLSLHPHLHCIVPGGGMDKNRQWKWVKKREKFLYPVKEMSKIFRAKFVAELRKNGIKEKGLYDRLFENNWVVYAKKPFKYASHIIEYLGRYTHKVAISNHRILNVSKTAIVFSAKNYKTGGNKVLLRLNTKEFIRRFSLHILPKGFVRMRHYGFLSSTGKRLYLADLKKELGDPELIVIAIESPYLQCPKCKIGTLKTVFVFRGRGPPTYWLKRIITSNNNRTKRINVAT